MYIFLSGEVGDIDFHEWNEILNSIDDKLSFVTDRNREKELIEDDTYGTEINFIGIIQMIVSPRFDSRPERRYIVFKRHEADIRLKIDYEAYQKADKAKKRLLMIKNIVDSIMVIEKRKRGDFQGEKLINDILEALEVTKTDLENL